MNIEVLGIVGQKRSGKDTAAQALIDAYGFRKVAFADKLRELLLAIDPYILTGIETADLGYYQRLSSIVEQSGWEGAKHYAEVGRLMQVTGTEGVRHVLGQDTWTHAWHDELVKLSEQGETRFVATDVRFENEALAVRRWRGPVVRIVRPLAQDDDPRDSSHASETELEGITPDFTIVNDGTIEDLRLKVLSLYENMGARFPVGNYCGYDWPEDPQPEGSYAHCPLVIGHRARHRKVITRVPVPRRNP